MIMIYATEKDVQTLSDRLYRYMARTGHDIHSLGETLGLPGPTIATFLSGESWPLPSTLLAFAGLEVSDVEN